MFPYWLMFAFFATGALSQQARTYGPSTSRPLLVLAACVMALMIGLRFEVGPDWLSYVWMYQAAGRTDFASAIAHSDPGFFTLLWLISGFHVEIWLVNIACAAIFVTGLISFARQQPNPWLAATVAVPYLVIVIAMSGTRQATAIGFILLALAAFSQRRLFKFMFWVIFASLFHASALLMLIIVGLSYTRNRFQALVLLGISAFPAYLILSASFETYIRRYTDINLQSEGTIYRVLMNFIPALILLFNIDKFVTERHDRTLWRNISILSLLCLPILFVVPSSTALDRVTLYLIPIQLFALSRIPSVFSSNSRNYSLYCLAVIIYLAAIMFVYLNYSTHGRYYIPYQVYPLFD